MPGNDLNSLSVVEYAISIVGVTDIIIAGKFFMHLFVLVSPSFGILQVITIVEPFERQHRVKTSDCWSIG